MSEQDLCAWFQGVAEQRGFVVYNEWADFDQLLVATNGTQIGVEAKLRGNVEVLAQAISGWDRSGPQHRGVLVPKASRSFHLIADALGLVVFEKRAYPTESWKWSLNRFWTLPTATRFVWGNGAKLPEIVPDVVGGAPAPVRLTPWKLKAIRLCNRLREQGYVTVADFREFGVDPTRWRHHWLRPDGKVGRATKWVPIGGDVKLPDEQHPEVAAQLREAS